MILEAREARLYQLPCEGDGVVGLDVQAPAVLGDDGLWYVGPRV